MTDLAADIARIAALRGKPVDHYAQIDRQARRISAEQVRGIFTPLEDWRAELRAWDRLSANARAVLRDLPFSVSAIKYHALYSQIRDEAALLAAVRAELPRVERARADDHTLLRP